MMNKIDQTNMTVNEEIITLTPSNDSLRFIRQQNQVGLFSPNATDGAFSMVTQANPGTGAYYRTRKASRYAFSGVRVKNG